MNSRFGNHFDHLVDEIAAHYGVGNRFASAYLRRWEKPGSLPQGVQLHRLKDIHDLPDPFPMWFDYAMTANQRGKDMAALLIPHAAPRARRYLDVGCGLGGFLVAFAQRGLDVFGFDVDLERVQLARFNLQDFGIPEQKAVRGDLLDAAFVATLGKFDIITMIDVIEHVLDVPKALETVLNLLTDNGILLLEIPNPSNLAAVAQDGHFQLFGITLLDRPDAIAYHRQYFKFAYDVGDYYALDYYQEWFRRQGCQVEMLYSARPLPPETAFQPALELLLQRWGKHVSEGARRLPEDLNLTLMTRVHGYFDQLLGDRIALSEQALSWNAFAQEYLLDFGVMLVRRPGANRRLSTEPNPIPARPVPPA